MTYSRRDLCLLVSALAVSPAGEAQGMALSSKLLPYEALPVRKNGANESRAIFSGELQTGGNIEVHQTRLAPAGMPHAPHHHVHEEMFLIREGTFEVTISGHMARLGPGSVAFVGSNDEHGVRNTGTSPTEYFVVALGEES